MKRLLITGGAGQLGTQLINAAAADWETYATYHRHPLTRPGVQAVPLDLSEAAAVQRLVRDLHPDVIIHTACSNRTPAHIQAIVPAARHLALAARAAAARFIHISTDMVFDGEQAPYADEARPTPLSDYGRAKAEAETLVAALDPSAAIVRPSLIWCLQPLDHQTRWLVDAVRTRQPLTLFTDEIRCPVYGHDLCAVLLELADRPEISGPLNAGGPQPLSRWDFGLKLLAALNLPPGPAIRPGTLRAAGLAHRRARDLTLDTPRLTHWLHTRLRSVDDILASGLN